MECFLHWSRVDQRHIGKRNHVSMAAQSDGESCFQIRLIEARECSAGIRRLHLRRGHVSVWQLFNSK